MWLGAIYADWPYGFASAQWDAEFPSAAALNTFFNGVAAVNTATEVFGFYWVPSHKGGKMRKALTKAGFTNLQDCFWWKHDLTRAGPVHMLTEAVEMFVVGMKDFNPRHAKLAMNLDPRERHNMVIGPALTAYAMHRGDGLAVNIREKPEYLAHKIVEPYLQPLDWVLVPCAGACGDVRGLLNKGLNVLAIEKDPRQYDACVAMFNAWKPEPQTVRGALPLSVVREALQNARQVQAQFEENVHEVANCDACNTDFDATQSKACERCGLCFFCRVCADAGCSLCVDCVARDSGPLDVIT